MTIDEIFYAVLPLVTFVIGAVIGRWQRNEGKDEVKKE